MEATASLLLILKSDYRLPITKQQKNNRLPGVKAKQTVAVF